MTITIRRCSVADFAKAQLPWNTLLRQSSADPLFMSWEWQYQWWKNVGGPTGLELCLLSAFDRGNILVGLAPLFLSRTRFRGIIRSRQLQFIGSHEGGIRTEHMDFIARKDRHQEVVTAFLQHITVAIEWDQFVLPELPAESATGPLIASQTTQSKIHVREARRFKSYYIPTDGSFDDYLSALGRHTRLRIFNRRKHLSRHGNITFVSAEAGSLDTAFATLNRLHRIRWGRDCFEGTRLDFALGIASELAPRGDLLLDIMKVDDRPVSALFSVRAQGYLYNLQSGFDETFDRRIPLGYLHFGYAIENAFRDPNTARIYFLAGGGKNSAYKERLTGHFHEMSELRLVRSRWLQMLYRFNDFLKKQALPPPSAPHAGEPVTAPTGPWHVLTTEQRMS